MDLANNSTYYLIGNSTEIPSERNDDEEMQKRNDTEAMYPILSIIESIGTEEFENTWDVLKNEIITLDNNYRYIFIQLALDKFEEKYGITLIPKLEPSVYILPNEFDTFLTFIQFIEIDSREMMGYIFYVMNIDSRNFLTIKKKNFQKIYYGVLKYIQNYIVNPLIKSFLENSDAEVLRKWLNSILSRYKIDIYTNSQERRIRYEQDYRD
ncbi:MAG: hypothetical protein KatS3mg002_0216 [Candidatus Woesearchaeota archaeon]|nr:MAG: hypothetical protein KatS3mg002_0216 [Candidatus Woesearchaeota archaeon]